MLTRLRGLEIDPFVGERAGVAGEAGTVVEESSVVSGWGGRAGRGPLGVQAVKERTPSDLVTLGAPHAARAGTIVLARKALSVPAERAGVRGGEAHG